MGFSAGRYLSRRVAAAVVLFSMLTLLFWSSAYLQRAFFDWFSVLESYAQAHEAQGMALFFMFAALSVLLGPFTSVPLVPFAVGAWGIPKTFFMLFSGWLLGGAIAYAIGYYWGYPLVKHLVSIQKIERWREQLGDHLEFFILFLFRAAMPSETGYFFGILRYHFGRYLFITAVAELPFALVAVHASDAFLAKEPAIVVGFAAVGAAIIIAALLLLRLRLRKRSPRQEI